MRQYYSNAVVTLIGIQAKAKVDEEELDLLDILKRITWKDEKGYKSTDRVSLRLHEALREIKNRGRGNPVDGIYSILGLLPYGEKVAVKYKKRNCDQCGEEEKDNCSTGIEGGIKVDYISQKDEEVIQPDGSLKITGSEYVITKNGEEKEIELSGTKQILSLMNKLVKEGKNNICLLMPNKYQWRSNKPFAVLVEIEGNKYYGLGLVEISEGSDKLQGVEERKIVISANQGSETNVQVEIKREGNDHISKEQNSAIFEQLVRLRLV
ncbi:10684_t:CDS:2 [Ambispora gerdemannii]|uniref:10684_t:CDS:1 n=1 Tax=Ambispora gerdemannii TaxID=144530 RepID=A0A9N9GKM2_9GLOM|nr:10684_t:CDS:2 [Ambispora gerdemannii]